MWFFGIEKRNRVCNKYVRYGASYPFIKYNFKCLKVIIALLHFNIQWRQTKVTGFEAVTFFYVTKAALLSSKACLTCSNVCYFFNSLKIRLKKKPTLSYIDLGQISKSCYEDQDWAWWHMTCSQYLGT